MPDQPQGRGTEVARQLEARGVTAARIIDALAEVDRAAFLPAELAARAAEDVTLELRGGAVVPRIFVLARWLELLDPRPEHRVLLVGVDSGYVLAVLARLCREVRAIDDNDQYARLENAVIEAAGLANAHVRPGTVSEGWPEAAPYDRILVARPLRAIPKPLLDQLTPGGRALMPVGPDWSHLFLELAEKDAAGRVTTRHVSARDIVPVPRHLPRIEEGRSSDFEVARVVERHMRPFESIEGFDMDALLERIGDARVVLLGEATHGTSEFYRMRAAITRALIERRGFSIVACEADWPDMEVVNAHVRGEDWWAGGRPRTRPFARFPRWMWRNEEFAEFVEWLHARNASGRPPASIYGLDLYGLENALHHVLEYLERRDPALADVARRQYGCLTPYLPEPAEYGRLVLSREIESCEQAVTGMLVELLREREKLDHSEAYFHLVRNATVIADAERYYKVMFYGSAESWNLRDMHMFQTLRGLLSFHGPDARAVVWAHNSHVGNAVATEMFARGEINIGNLAREAFGNAAYAIGFGTNTGQVAAADVWGGPMRIKDVRAALPESYERVCHLAGCPAFTLPLRSGIAAEELVARLSEPRLERAIGVIYRPETERQSHYFMAALPSQFDEFIWFERTAPVAALDRAGALPAPPAPHPFAALDE